MKITIVCNYKVYPQNSCPVEDDRRGVSVCPNICLKEETLQPMRPAPRPAATILEVQTPKLCSNRPQGLDWVSDSFSPVSFPTRNKSLGICSSKQSHGCPSSCPTCLQLPYITSSEQDVPSCFATTPMHTQSLSLMQVVLADPLQNANSTC